MWALLPFAALAGTPESDAETFLRWASRLDAPSPHPAPATGYRFAAQHFQEIATWVARAPAVVAPERIGTSTDGRPIWAFHVTDPGRPPERDVLIFANVHALEWLGTEVVTDLLVELAKAPPAVRVTLVPILNPDGRARVEQDLVAGRNLYRRGNAAQVDLNRDFAVNTEVRAVWAAILPGYYDHSDVPLSQPESRALDDVAARGGYERAASLHAFGGFFFYPWSGRFRRPPHRAEFAELGAAMAVAMGRRPYTTRQLGRWGFFFRAQGSEIDHLYGRYGTRAFLVELTRSGLDPVRPATWRSYFRWYNPTNPDDHVRGGVAAMRALIRHPGLSGEAMLGPVDPPDTIPSP